jgi:hypothetical protein
MPSAADKLGSGVSPDYDTTQHADEQKKTNRSGQAGRLEEGGFGVIPQLRESNSRARKKRPSGEGGSGIYPVYSYPTRTQTEEGQAERSGRAERSGEGGLGAHPTTAQHKTPTRRRKPSAAATPSAAEKGGSGVSPNYGNPTRTHAEEGQAERSGQAKRCGKGGFGGLP